MHYSYEKRAVAFIDLLGFSERVRNSITPEGFYNISEISRIVDLLDTFKRGASAASAQFDGLIKPPMTTQFSDCVIISFDPTEPGQVYHNLNYIQSFLLELLELNVACRGSVVFGDIVHSDQFVFGPAVVDAVENEKCIAVNPRVIVDEKVISVGSKHPMSHNTEASERTLITDLLSIEDNLHFIDIASPVAALKAKVVQGFVQQHYDNLTQLESNMRSHSQPKVVSKGEWLGKYVTTSRENPKQVMENINLISVEGSRAWKDVTSLEVQAVAKAAFHTIFLNMQCPLTLQFPIVIDWSSAWGEGGPVTKYLPSEDRIVTSFEGEAGQWGKFIFELGHEYGHILMNSRFLPLREAAWFEETFCDIFSRFCLQEMESALDKFPALNNISGMQRGTFSNYLWQHRNQMDRSETGTNPFLSSLVTAKIQELRIWVNRYALVNYTIVESSLLPIVASVTGREALARLNWSKNAAANEAEYFSNWIQACPDPEVPRAILRLFGF
ncbi:MAG TPA: hypothetical protein VFH95_05955 [Candidatus Kapabacteria bacterium]|nr:hypothetical protein [Candidatus Kapabacteria bacterium]